jgi:hypothetical protein
MSKQTKPTIVLETTNTRAKAVGDFLAVTAFCYSHSLWVHICDMHCR